MNAHKETIKSFTDLYAWQHAHRLTVDVYRITQAFPKEQIYSLANQMQRAAVSVSSNIAEGFGRFTSKDQTHFLYQSLASLRELHSQILVSTELGFINYSDKQKLLSQVNTTSKILNGLIKSSKENRHKTIDKRL